MERRQDTAHIVFGSVLTTLIGLFVAAALFFALLVTVSPSSAYALYAASYNGKGMAVYAAKLADLADARYAALEGEAASEYNLGERLPAAWRAVHDASAYYGAGNCPAAVTERMRSFVSDSEFAEFAAEDADNVTHYSPRNHVAVTDSFSYYRRVFVDMLYARDTAEARQTAVADFEVWAETVGTLDSFGTEILPSGGYIAYLECSYAHADGASHAAEIETFRALAEDESVLVLVRTAEEDELIHALHVAGNVLRMGRLYRELDESLAPSEAVLERWSAAYQHRMNAYVAYYNQTH